MLSAEHYATPLHANLGGYFSRVNDFNDIFYIRWGKIEFDVHYGVQANVKVILKTYRDHNICETYIVDTDAYTSGRRGIFTFIRTRRFSAPSTASNFPLSCI